MTPGPVEVSYIAITVKALLGLAVVALLVFFPINGFAEKRKRK